jgi:D-alanyl-D-alanine carboxypeptidase/D-alanyl-D-alanine-endopeptidase (penicillin-binding protein 4)
MLRITFILLLVHLSFLGQPIAPRISTVVAQNKRVHWGIHAVQLKSGRVLASVNADQFFIPASNTKLFSTAFALTALGPDHRFTTRVLAGAPPDANGVLKGNLILLGGGDPSLSSRRYPYDLKKPFEDDRLLPLRELARQLRDRGVRRITGKVIGDDSAQPFDPIPSGWAADDGIFEYGAPVSALSFNDNVFGITVSPAGIALDPPVEYFALLNQVSSEPGDPRRVRVVRQPGSRTAVLTGNIPPEGRTYTNDLAVDDPALYAALAFRHVLLEEGIRVDGGAECRHLAPPQPETIELARRDSPPLLQVLQVVNKVSQNLHAEMVLRAASAKMPFADFLKLAGVDEKDSNFEDGSGMSRLNLVTPKAVVQLLRFMDKQGQLETFRDLLAIGAEDGTLRNRFDKSTKAKGIRAKTGSLSHVSALGGYAESKRHGTIAFQIVANNYNVPAQEVRTAIDRIALALLQ